MAKRIITISREFGSGGRFIGEEVAKKLGIEELLEKYPYEISGGQKQRVDRLQLTGQIF